MKAKQLIKLTVEELNDKQKQLKSEINTMAFDLKIGVEQDKRGFKEKKKTLARVNTVLTQKQKEK